LTVKENEVLAEIIKNIEEKEIGFNKLLTDVNAQNYPAFSE
jgi:hypothetical protein